MAVKKTAKKAASKAAAPKKAAPKKVAAKKTASKKTTPAPKVAAKKAAKPAAKKTAPAKKVAPVKKAAAKKVAPVKKPAPAKKSAPVKKAAPAPVAKKATPTPKGKATAKAAAKPAAKKSVPAKKAKDIKIVPAKPVSLPKFSTKTSRTYNPAFTNSVLDQKKPDNTTNIVRYSDSDLNEFRELIMRKLDAASKELQYLQGVITRKDNMGGEDNAGRYMTMEDGSLSMEREQLSQMASRQITFVDHLKKALMRIENKTYGICRVTGQLIDKARLKAVPHATLSIEAKLEQNR